MTRVDLVDLAGRCASGVCGAAVRFSGAWGSEGRRSSIGYHEARDVVAAARYLRRRPELAGCGIGALGMSMGAAATVIAAARGAGDRRWWRIAGLRRWSRLWWGACGVLYRLPAFPFAPLIVRFGELLLGARIREMRPIDHIGRIAPRPLLIVHGERDRLIRLRRVRALRGGGGVGGVVGGARGGSCAGGGEGEAEEYAAGGCVFGAALKKPEMRDKCEPGG
ncbi:MAG: hypothetical protein U0232_25810 [Thermomicrobiales bacterium]